MIWDADIVTRWRLCVGHVTTGLCRRPRPTEAHKTFTETHETLGRTFENIVILARILGSDDVEQHPSLTVWLSRITPSKPHEPFTESHESLAIVVGRNHRDGIADNSVLCRHQRTQLFQESLPVEYRIAVESHSRSSASESHEVARRSWVDVVRQGVLG